MDEYNYTRVEATYMIGSEELRERLEFLGIKPEGSVVKGDSGPAHFFVYVSVTRDGENRQMPSNLQLEQVKQKLLLENIFVDFLLHDSLTNDIEAGLRATLLHAFGASLRNCFLSTDKRVANLWVEQKKHIENDEMQLIAKRAREFLQNFNLTEVNVLSTSMENIPGVLACLRVIRSLAPVKTDRLAERLIELGFSIPSIDWMSRRVDSMRKEGRIVRREDGGYVLSLNSLLNLGTAKGRESPDIQRLLALASSKG